MCLSLAKAKTLQPGDVLFHKVNKNADGSMQRWKVNGKVKVWKSRPDQVRIPVKNGLYNYGYVTER